MTNDAVVQEKLTGRVSRNLFSRRWLLLVAIIMMCALSLTPLT
jgi:hypothetical protein